MSYVEIDIDEKIQRKAIKKVLDIGQKDEIHPLAFAIALFQAIEIICEQTGVAIESITSHSQDSDSMH